MEQPSLSLGIEEFSMMETTWELGLAGRMKVGRMFQEGAARHGETWKPMDVGGH